MLTYTETPVIEINDTILKRHGIKLLVKREDLNHPTICGNKWWKLKYNLEDARSQGLSTLLTFGGAFSNHLVATAAAASELGWNSVGVVRGEKPLPLNDVLRFVSSKGMALHYVSREAYARKADPSFLHSLRDKFGSTYVIPEGGTNSLAVRSCTELGRKLMKEIEFDSLWLPVGTGGTLAGIIQGFEGGREVVGVSVLKGGTFLIDEVKRLMSETSKRDFNNWSIQTEYHFGGFAKTTTELLDFIQSMQQLGLPLDTVYTSKLMFAVYDNILKGRIKAPHTILALHTGGLPEISIE